MDESLSLVPRPEKPVDKENKKKRVDEIGSTLAQIRARMKANRSCARKDEDSSGSTSTSLAREQLSEKSELYMQVIEQDKAKAQKLEKERPKIKEAIENLMIDRENLKLVEKKIEESRAKQLAPLPEIPQEVQKRILDLEMSIHVLKETLAEKEEVLQSKTDSWRLLNEQLEKRNHEVIERSERMKKEIDGVKEAYAEREALLISELEAMKERLQESQSMMLNRECDNSEIAALKADLDSLKSTHSECDSRFAETKKAWDTEKRLALKLKAQLKNLKNEVASKKGENLSAELEKLQNQIASLEEEKGNLLLQLVDFDEIKENALKSANKLSELESVLSASAKEMECIREDYRSLKLDLENALAKNINQDDEISRLRSSLAKAEQLKIEAEMKAVTLEEKLDSSIENDTGTDKVDKDMDNLRQYIVELEKNTASMKDELVMREQEVDQLRAEQVVKQARTEAIGHAEMKDLLLEWREKYNEVVENMNKFDQERCKLLDEIRNFSSETESLKKVNSELEQRIKEAIDSQTALNIEKESLRERLTKLEMENAHLKTLDEERAGKEEGVGKNASQSDQKQKLRKVLANLKIKTNLCTELEGKVRDLTKELEGKTEIIRSYEAEKGKLEEILAEKSEMEKMLSEKDSIIESMERVNQAEMLAVEETFTRVRAASFSEMSEKDSTIKQLREENLRLESKLNENRTEIHSVGDRTIQDLVEENKTLTEHIQAQVAQMKLLAAERDTSKEKVLELEVIVENLNSQISSLIDKSTDTLEELNRVKRQISDVEKEKASLVQMRDDIEKKCEAVQTLEGEIKSLEAELNVKNEEIGRLEALYQEAALRNDGVLNNIEGLEAEMLSSKNEINQLCEQLAEVNSDYFQMQEVLREKDAHICNLEQELDNMKNRVYNMESVIEERQKAMEINAKALSERLTQAEKMNANYEASQREMAERVDRFVKTEDTLKFEMTSLLDRLESSTKENAEFELKAKEASERSVELEAELNDIKSAYATTLDQIEALNDELKQVMSEIEGRNEELIRISEERRSMALKIGDLDQVCDDLRTRLEESERVCETLRLEVAVKTGYLEEAAKELLDLKSASARSNEAAENMKIQYEDRMRQLELNIEKTSQSIGGSNNAEAKVSDVKEGDIAVFKWDAAEVKNAPDPFSRDDDEGWGWGSSEAKLEEAHQNSESNRICELMKKAADLENENLQLKEEMKSVKINCAKLAKKLKELKAQKEQHEKSKSSSTGFEDLNFALQEELSGKVSELETKIKEMTDEINTGKIEKGKLMKRVDTLTSANEQLIEMKERHDIEVQVFQRNISDLKAQLLNSDWGAVESDAKDNASSNSQPVTDISLTNMAPIVDAELAEKLAFLEAENEELQQILTSMRDVKMENQNLIYEVNSLKEELKHVQVASPGSDTLTQNRNEIPLARNLFSDVGDSPFNVSGSTQAKTDEDTLNSVLAERDRIENQLKITQNELSSAKEKICDFEKQIVDISSERDQIVSQLNCFQKDCDDKNTHFLELQSKYDSLVKEKDQLFSINENLISENNNLMSNNEDLMNKLTSADEEVKRLQCTAQSLSEEVMLKESLKSGMSELKDELARVTHNLMQLEKENESLRNEWDSDAAQYESLKVSVNDLNESIRLLEGEKAELNNSLSESKLLIENYAKGHSEIMSSVDQMKATIDSLERENNCLKAEMLRLKVIPASDDHGSESVATSVASPPIFKGFFSGGDDPFADVGIPVQEERISKTVVQDVKQEVEYPSGDLKRRIESLETENTELLLRLEDALKINSSREDEIKRAQCDSEKELSVLRERVNELLEHIQELEVNLKEVTETRDRFSIENKSIAARIVELEDRAVKGFDDANQFSEEMRVREAWFQNSLLSKDEENAHLTCEVSAKQQALEELSREVSTLKEKVKSLEFDLVAAIEQRDSSNDNHRRAEEKLVEMEKHFNEIKQYESQQYIAQVDYLNQAAVAKDSTIESLTQRVNEQNVELIRLRENLIAVTDRYKNVESEYQSLVEIHSNDKNMLSNQLNHSENERSNLESRLIEVTNEFTKYRSRIESADSDRTEHETRIREEMELLEEAIREKDLAIEHLSKVFSDAQERLIAAEQGRTTDKSVLLRSKLDRALYTLHLRDVRCEELTLEIMHLLEERDILQLRLSEALRGNELLRSVKQPSESVSSTAEPLSSTGETTLPNYSKLDEVHAGYMKDPVVKKDRQNRYSDQMNLLNPSSKVEKEEDSSPSLFQWIFGSSSSTAEHA